MLQLIDSGGLGGSGTLRHLLRYLLCYLIHASYAMPGTDSGLCGTRDLHWRSDAGHFDGQDGRCGAPCSSPARARCNVGN
eukprot:718358-Rhodomonas_salina.10